MNAVFSRLRPALSSRTVILVITLFFTFALNATLWRYVYRCLPFTDLTSLLIWAEFPITLFALLYIIFNAICWPYLTKPLGVFLLISGAIATYMMLRYGILIDSSMIRNVFETNPREAFDYVNPSSIFWPVLLGLIPAILLCWTKIQYRKPSREIAWHLICIVASALVVALIAVTSYKPLAFFGRNHKEIIRYIVPYNYVQGTIRYFQKRAEANQPFEVIDATPKQTPYANSERTILIIAIGESSRSTNYSLNGYPRETDPELSKEDVVSFRNVLSDGTYTALSVPSIFSYLPRHKFDIDRAARTENLLDIARRAGYETLWVENDDGCKGVCNRTPTITPNEKTNPKYCFKDYCYDEVLLSGLEEKIRSSDKNMVIVLHLMGSHGPSYFKRYPKEFDKFEPACKTKEVRNCSRAEIINAYDNTILYTDHVLDGMIQLLKKFPKYESGLIYVSDHGESLGENGIYLHGIPYAFAPIEQKHVPMILWMNDTMKKDDHIDYACVKAKFEHPLSQDYIFHTVVEWLEIKTRVYDPNYDFLASCRSEPVPN